MTMANRPPWGTTRESVTTWLGRYGRPVFNATGVVRGSVKCPKLGEGDATAIVSATGLDAWKMTTWSATRHAIKPDEG
jgi:hypothetical protein